MWTYTPSKSAPAWACLVKDCEPGSPTWASRIAPLHTLSGKHTPPASWQRAWKTAPWMAHLSGPTYSPLTVQRGVAQWIASLRDSRAKTSHSPGDAPGLMAHDLACFSTSLTLPTLAVRDSSFWRTSQASLLPPPPLWTKPKALSKNAQPPASWENWPTEGGMRSGSLCQRPKWVPATGGRGGSALPGENWTTPQAHDVTERGSGQQPTAAAGNACLARDARTWATPDCNTSTYSNGKMGPNIREQARMWQTPTATEEESGSGLRGNGEPKLKGQAIQWATPQARDCKNPDSAESGNYQRKLDQGYTIDLNSQAHNWWPTPAARDHKGANSEQHATVTGGGQETHGSTSQLCGLFAPGPSDPRWAGIIAAQPWLAPAIDKATESLLCGAPDGLATGLDFSHRAQRLKCVGNGVVALQAAAAFVVLARRAGLMKKQPLALTHKAPVAIELETTP
jgi:hypothetical protein